MSNLSQLSKAQQQQQQQVQQQAQSSSKQEVQNSSSDELDSPTIYSPSTSHSFEEDIVLINNSSSSQTPTQLYSLTNSPGTYPIQRQVLVSPSGSKTLSPLRLPEALPSSLSPPPLNLEPKRCWICLGDDSDSEGSMPSMQFNYQFSEPNSLIVDLFSKVDNFLLSAVPYFSIFGLTCSILITSTTYGAYAVLTICGVEQGEQILGSPDPWGWRVWIGLPLIPFILISSRTTYLDHLMPLLPALFIKNDQLEFSFPPSPALTVSLLPWIRLVYNFGYSHFFGNLERDWRENFRPRGGNSSAEITLRNGNNNADGQVENGEELENEEEEEEANILVRGGQYRFNFFRDLVRPIVVHFVCQLFVPSRDIFYIKYHLSEPN
ncbi:hypothetical protein CONCODRAFT_13473 [Conidiobolus coronatus NRRL 28638]|uniref:Uncharacterized protein n=1 Tax=Conidiobolus coronatus (strain ATCC 28846 / CBS 209.66 / NRRL 28638) TaxID=796925 RepID=A0A137NQW4_CONC2|nr:hypothetical protein CONCODRAFT_13473 [Conidiobolus coronatus NRRL 28638]|eukprot:KXN65070.1 hypothetical protein CONCODRAFT_13473 [Conidiobolus coronatus NRRL 28638]